MSEAKASKQESGGARLGWVLLLVLVLLVASLGYYFFAGQQEFQRVGRTDDMRVLSQQLAKNASEASRGTNAAFANLSQVSRQFSDNISALNNGDTSAGLLEAPEAIAKGELAKVNATWREVEKNAGIILGAEEQVQQLYEIADSLATVIPQLQSEYTTVMDILLDGRAPAEQVYWATRQTWLAERISGGMQKVLRGGEEAEIAAENFGHDVDVFGQVLNGQLQGDDLLEIRRVNNAEARAALEAVAEIYSDVANKVEYIVQTTPTLFEVQKASDKIFRDTGLLLNQTSALSDAFQANVGANPVEQILGKWWVSVALFGLFALLLLALYRQQRRSEKLRLQATNEIAAKEKDQNEQNQQAIIRLLDEMEGLADGDLTVETTVTEDFTGAIADAFNYTIDQLRSLVSTINNAVSRVGKAASETESNSRQLARASKQQAQEITGASAAINEMAVSIEQVSANASESSQVAEKSVEIAKKGGAVVRNTISGMDTIREQIQETSKRIKRLGESSQEIGNIVSLINDISDQTNILALNAAIQASAAGEAGRGFAVVADEVQRLAERSGNATKQIEALVKTIQTDTNEAVISMEDTTTEVVRGAALTQDAGVALEEIEHVSTHLADLIQNISNAARQQAASAGHVSNTMNVIQEITSQTSEGTEETAQAIGKMAELAEELRQTVAGFKLSNEDKGAIESEDYYEEMGEELRREAV